MNQKHDRRCPGEMSCHCAHLRVDLCDYAALHKKLAETKAELEHLKIRYENRKQPTRAEAKP